MIFPVLVLLAVIACFSKDPLVEAPGSQVTARDPLGEKHVIDGS